MTNFFIGERLRHDKQLTSTDKVVYLEISTDARLNNKCSKTNTELGTLLDKSYKTISRSLSILEDKGYIKLQYTGNVRYIKITPLDELVRNKYQDKHHVTSTLKKNFD